jgi:hypothetical protein
MSSVSILSVDEILMDCLEFDYKYQMNRKMIASANEQADVETLD